MARVRIGDLLIKQGLITESQLQEALNLQKQQKGLRLGEVLLQTGAIKEEDFAVVLGSHLSLPFASYASGLLKPKTDQDLDKLVNYDFARKNLVLPLNKNLHSLTCAVFDPLDYFILDNLKILTGCDLNLVIGTKTDISRAINEFYVTGKEARGKEGGSILDQTLQQSYAEGEKVVKAEDRGHSADSELSIDSLIAKAGEAPVIKLVDLVIRQAIDERASDIHIEPFKDRLEIRYRIDGVLYQIPPPASHLHLPIVSRIKILAKLDIAEKRLPQDGNISAKLEDRVVDLRVSTIPTVWGEKVVLRLMDKGAVKLDLTTLGYEARALEGIRKALHSSYGLFFVTGPTGSGKSTTLYACLNEIFDPSLNIMSVEDPVEFKIDGVNQVSVRADIGLTFAAALRAFLRQDPDVIMVGEVRDLETAQICIRSALTGHLVLSTLHTNDAPSAVVRLMDIGVPHYLLTPSLVMIVAQRLARKLCPSCKEPYEANGMTVGGYKIKSDLIYRAKGCDECSHTGYKGRVVIAEVMAVNEEIRAMIGREATYNEIKDAARKNGMDTLFESGMKQVEGGVSSVDEILGVTTA
ncbi:MAG: Flp pilus assembly complex ATPase component TadA [Candidatus Omnitrophica bacterium]|nr:Flp pilus assembly complex ATPase component TadA [Candidatus Omnitrophota bacterium]MDE2009414.1 Flp pilus assembly complex ATPase component TadA [Candidatus Omnitrophota bacterium]MDE2214198.1 Flp pilus assembly complex ATPase component TadA [Candidatus Omnitrophota bacterium]MDE2231235.1 Flp pilus assembly complex ATPase component TadA [Candidatus Omnitrophota bacterium]